jgi:hypothetical protein
VSRRCECDRLAGSLAGLHAISASSGGPGAVVAARYLHHGEVAAAHAGAVNGGTFAPKARISAKLATH